MAKGPPSRDFTLFTVGASNLVRRDAANTPGRIIVNLGEVVVGAGVRREDLDLGG